MRDGTPVGTVRGSLYLPDGYIIADGSTVQRADYPRLVAFADEHNLWVDNQETQQQFTVTAKSLTANSQLILLADDDLKKIKLGDKIEGTGIPNDTTITEYRYFTSRDGANLNRGTETLYIVISNAVTTTGANVTLTITRTTRNEGKFGRGDGSTTLVLPNYIDKMIQLSDVAGTSLDAGLPNINAMHYTGTMHGLWRGSCETDSTLASMELSNKRQWHGAMYVDNNGMTRTYEPDPNGSGGANGGKFWFDASRSSPIYGNSDTVQPPAITLLPILRY